MRNRLTRLGVLIACTLLVGACQEDISGGAACPALCPEQNVVLKDTTLFPITIDTTLVGYPPLGSEGALILARRGDSLVTAGVMRFDTIAPHFPKFGSDTVTRNIVGIDSAFLSLTLSATTQVAKSAVTFEVYDVDTLATDPDTAAVRQLFRPDRLLATRTVPQDSLTGTLRFHFSPGFLLNRILAGDRVRFGVLVRSDSSVELRVVQGEAGPSGPVITFLARSHRDTPETRDTMRISILERSLSTVPDLEDYTLVLQGTPAPPPDALAVGGFPARRTYIRFDLPSSLIDSTTIVRAVLIVTQRPNRNVLGAADSLAILPRVVLASTLVDPGRSALLAQDPLAFGAGVPPIITTPQDSGQRRLDMPGVLRIWRSFDRDTRQRAIVLISGGEASLPGEVRFFSSEAPQESLRPRLRVTYIPRVGFGLP